MDTLEMWLRQSGLLLYLDILYIYIFTFTVERRLIKLSDGLCRAPRRFVGIFWVGFSLLILF